MKDLPSCDLQNVSKITCLSNLYPFSLCAAVALAFANLTQHQLMDEARVIGGRASRKESGGDPIEKFIADHVDKTMITLVTSFSFLVTFAKLSYVWFAT